MFFWPCWLHFFSLLNFGIDPTTYALWMVVFGLSLGVHEVGHCIAHIFFSRTNATGYYKINFWGISYYSGQESALSIITVALAGPLSACLFIMAFIVMFDFSFLLPLFVIHCWSLMPFNMDGSHFWGEAYNLFSRLK